VIQPAFFSHEDSLGVSLVAEKSTKPKRPTVSSP
jgi:hypothetical protein